MLLFCQHTSSMWLLKFNLQSKLIPSNFSEKEFFILKTAWKVSKYGVFSGPYFPVFGLNREIYGVNLRIQSQYTGKYGPEKTPYLDAFHAAEVSNFQKILVLSIQRVNRYRYLHYLNNFDECLIKLKLKETIWISTSVFFFVCEWMNYFFYVPFSSLPCHACLTLFWRFYKALLLISIN